MIMFDVLNDIFNCTEKCITYYYFKKFKLVVTCYIDDVLQDKCSKNVPQLSIKSDMYINVTPDNKLQNYAAFSYELDFPFYWLQCLY